MKNQYFLKKKYLNTWKKHTKTMSWYSKYLYVIYNKITLLPYTYRGNDFWNYNQRQISACSVLKNLKWSTLWSILAENLLMGLHFSCCKGHRIVINSLDRWMYGRSPPTAAHHLTLFIDLLTVSRRTILAEGCGVRFTVEGSWVWFLGGGGVAPTLCVHAVNVHLRNHL